MNVGKIQTMKGAVAANIARVVATVGGQRFDGLPCQADANSQQIALTGSQMGQAIDK